jgi:MFS family permease
VDLSNITFNKNNKLEAAAKDAATGIKLLALAFLAGAIAMILAVLSDRSQISGTVFSIVSFAFSFTAFAAGAYGAYLAACALGWSGFITVAIVLGAIIPYLRFTCFVVLVVFSIDLIRKADYKFSFFGPLRKRAAA